MKALAGKGTKAGLLLQVSTWFQALTFIYYHQVKNYTCLFSCVQYVIFVGTAQKEYKCVVRWREAILQVLQDC